MLGSEAFMAVMYSDNLNLQWHTDLVGWLQLLALASVLVWPMNQDTILQARGNNTSCYRCKVPVLSINSQSFLSSGSSTIWDHETYTGYILAL